MTKISEILTKVEVLTKEVCDFKEQYGKDISELKQDVKAINGNVRSNQQQLATHEQKFKEYNQRFEKQEAYLNNLVWNKKWFWVVIAVIILGLAGVNIADVVKLLGS